MDKLIDKLNKQNEEWNSMQERALKAEARVKELEGERDQFALDFASYMDNQRWRYDHKEQKEHTYREHLEYFKSKGEKEKH